MAHMTYHLTEHKLDFARRRRHLRKMTGDLRKPPIIRFKSKKVIILCACLCTYLSILVCVVHINVHDDIYVVVHSCTCTYVLCYCYNRFCWPVSDHV